MPPPKFVGLACIAGSLQRGLEAELLQQLPGRTTTAGNALADFQVFFEA